MTQYGALELLRQAYLHEHVDDDYESTWGTVDDFRSAKETCLIAQVARLLDSSRVAKSGSELHEILRRQIGCNYRPQAEGWTYRGWLEAVAVRVDEVLRSGGR